MRLKIRIPVPRWWRAVRTLFDPPRRQARPSEIVQARIRADIARQKAINARERKDYEQAYQRAMDNYCTNYRNALDNYKPTKQEAK